MKNKNFLIVLIILIAVAIVCNAPKRLNSKSEIQMSAFPKEIGEWVGKDILLSERDYEILETRNLIMRDYRNPMEDSVYLYIIYSEDNRRALHPPEICYSGGGATILEKSVDPITNSLKANRFIIENKDSRQLVAYWFKSTNLSTYSYLKQQIKIVADRMLRKKTYGAMIRVSVVIKDNNVDAAMGVVKSFIEKIEPELKKLLP